MANIDIEQIVQQVVNEVLAKGVSAPSYDKTVSLLNVGANRIGAGAGVAIVTGVRTEGEGY